MRPTDYAIGSPQSQEPIYPNEEETRRRSYHAIIFRTLAVRPMFSLRSSRKKSARLPRWWLSIEQTLSPSLASVTQLSGRTGIQVSASFASVVTTALGRFRDGREAGQDQILKARVQVSRQRSVIHTGPRLRGQRRPVMATLGVDTRREGMPEPSECFLRLATVFPAANGARSRRLFRLPSGAREPRRIGHRSSHGYVHRPVGHITLTRQPRPSAM